MKIWILTLMIGLNCLALKSQEEKLQMVKSFGEKTLNNSSFTIDHQNNIIVFIGFSDSIDADLGPGNHWMHATGSSYKYASLIAKYNSKLELSWAGIINGRILGQGLHLLTDNSDNIFISLRFEDSVEVDPSSVKKNIYGQKELDFAVIKLNTDGEFQFVKQFGSIAQDFLVDACLDKNGDIYLSGNFRDAMDFDPGSGMDTRTPGSPLDLFLIKLNNIGEYAWGIQFGGAGQPSGNGMNLDLDGNIIMTGQYANSSNFNPRGTAVNKSSKGDRDFFVARYTTDGNLIDVITGGGTGLDYASQVICTNKFNLNVFGTFNGTATFDPGNALMNMTAASGKDHFIAFYDTNGNCQFRAQKPIVSSEFIYYKPLLNSGNNETWFISDFKNKFDIDWSADSLFMTSKGLNDIFIQKLDMNNQLKTSGQIGSSKTDAVLSTFLTAKNELYIMGYCYDSCLIRYEGSAQLLRGDSLHGQVFLVKIATDNANGIRDVSFRETYIYPNPVNSGLLYIKAGNNAHYELMDLTGKKLLSGEFKMGESSLNIETIATGLYVLKIDGVGYKLIIQK